MEHGIKGTDPTWEARLKDFEGRMEARAKILIVPLTEERGQPKAGKCSWRLLFLSSQQL